MDTHCVLAAAGGAALVAAIAVPMFIRLKGRYERYTRNRVKSATEPMEIALRAALDDLHKERDAADKARGEHVKREAALQKDHKEAWDKLVQERIQLQEVSEAYRTCAMQTETDLQKRIAFLQDCIS